MVQNSALSVDWVIDNVPPDIWRHIFGFLDLKSYEGYRVKDGDVVRLSHVCCLWRDVVNNSPELWTEVDLYVSPTVVHPGIGLLSRILHNSRDMPLVMSLEIHGNSTAPSNLINDACKLFFREVLRAEHLDLRIYGQTPLQGIEAEIQGGLMLQNLCINIPYKDEGIMSIVSTLWSPAPSLQSLILAHIGHYFSMQNVDSLQAHNFPFQQVIDLEVEFEIHLDVICQLMSLMPSLAFVTLNGVLDARELINPKLVILLLICLCKSMPEYSEVAVYETWRTTIQLASCSETNSEQPDANAPFAVNVTQRAAERETVPDSEGKNTSYVRDVVEEEDTGRVDTARQKRSVGVGMVEDVTIL